MDTILNMQDILIQFYFLYCFRSLWWYG